MNKIDIMAAIISGKDIFIKNIDDLFMLDLVKPVYLKYGNSGVIIVFELCIKSKIELLGFSTYVYSNIGQSNEYQHIDVATVLTDHASHTYGPIYYGSYFDGLYEKTKQYIREKYSDLFYDS